LYERVEVYFNLKAVRVRRKREWFLTRKKRMEVGPMAIEDDVLHLKHEGDDGLQSRRGWPPLMGWGGLHLWDRGGLHCNAFHPALV
jgi:hypothetical protein